MNIAGSQTRQRSRQIMNLVTLMGQLLAAFRASHRRVLLRRLQGKASDASDARRCPRTPLLTLSAGPYLGRGESRSPSRCQRAGSSRTGSRRSEGTSPTAGSTLSTAAVASGVALLGLAVLEPSRPLHGWPAADGVWSSGCSPSTCPACSSPGTSPRCSPSQSHLGSPTRKTTWRRVG
jgi:hypothetical protein